MPLFHVVCVCVCVCVRERGKKKKKISFDMLGTDQPKENMLF